MSGSDKTEEDEGETRVPTEAEKLLSWRESVLEIAGFNRLQAEALADTPGVDLHLAVELLKRGCDPETAVDILL